MPPRAPIANPHAKLFSTPPVPNRPLPRETLVSVVLPVFNEAAVLPRLTQALEDALGACGSRYEIVYVNDGSTDGSEELLDELAAGRRGVVAVHLSRNFGQQAALQAGLGTARGDAVIVMDSDFQDDPAAIPRFLERWREGFDVVYAVRTKRKESPLKRFLFRAFYRLLGRASRTPIPLDAGNFGLIDRRVARDLRALAESDRYFPGLRGWVGYRQTGLAVERLDRHDGTPRVSLMGLCRLAKTAVFSFSTAPLALFYLIAAASCLVCVGLAAFTLYQKFVTGAAILGWTSGLMTASFFGTLNALGVAVLGEYVVRIHDQVRGRPAYLIDRTTGEATPHPPQRCFADVVEAVSPPVSDAELSAAR
jgi:dolichol-phosphate mannosyltransferase